MCIAPANSELMNLYYKMSGKVKKSTCNLLRHFNGEKNPHGSLLPKQMEVRVFILKGIFIDCDFVYMRKKQKCSLLSGI